MPPDFMEATTECHMASQKWGCTHVEPIGSHTSTMAATTWCQESDTKSLKRFQLYIKRNQIRLEQFYMGSGCHYPPL